MMLRRIVLLLIIMGLTFGIAGAYASSSATATLSSTSPSTRSGRPYDLESYTGEFTVTKGAAQVTQGYAIYLIDNIESGYHDTLNIHLFLTNPRESLKAGWFVDAGLWYENSLLGFHKKRIGSVKN